MHDKKTIQGKVHFVLPVRIGEVTVVSGIAEEAGAGSHPVCAGMSGTTPQGTRSETEAASWVRGMFGRVAHRYDLVNHLLSFNVDRLWRAHTVRRVRSILDRPEARVLDICCGTGDLLLALERGSRRGRVMGSDFCHPMLVAARDKVERRRCPRGPVRIRRLAPAGARPFARPDHGGVRIPQPGELRGRACARCTACCGPAEWRPSWSSRSLRIARFGALYNFYSRRVLPLIGGAISGSRDAYTYLPESVRKFPTAPQLAGSMRLAGFDRVSFEYLTGGIVALHYGVAA